jgi:hypothetical protein
LVADEFAPFHLLPSLLNIKTKNDFSNIDTTICLGLRPSDRQTCFICELYHPVDVVPEIETLPFINDAKHIASGTL